MRILGEMCHAFRSKSATIPDLLLTPGGVLLDDGRSLNEELVRAGLAWWYLAYTPNDTNLAQLAAQAREAQRGLWADVEPVPPGQWRKARAQR